MKWITVVKLGADGGSLRLLGLKKRNRDWSFLLSSDESTMDGLLSEEDAEGMSFKSQSNEVVGWEKAVELLNERYPRWLHLLPIGEIHPDFVVKIAIAASRKLPRDEFLDNWGMHFRLPIHEQGWKQGLAEQKHWRKGYG